jgi:hypothetical protein
MSDLKNDVIPTPRLSELVNAEGDIVYRRRFHSEIIIIRRDEVERMLAGKELNDTTVWEIIQKTCQDEK